MNLYTPGIEIHHYDVIKQYKNELNLPLEKDMFMRSGMVRFFLIKKFAL